MKKKKPKKSLCFGCNYAIILDGKIAFCNILMRKVSYKSCTAYERNWQINDIVRRKRRRKKGIKNLVKAYINIKLLWESDKGIMLLRHYPFLF